MTDPIQQIEERIAQLKFCPDSGFGRDISNILKLVKAYEDKMIHEDHKHTLIGTNVLYLNMPKWIQEKKKEIFGEK